MTVPLDRLYTHLASLCNRNIVISCWTPHGSKNLLDLKPTAPVHDLNPFDTFGVIAHDQEPLYYDLWTAEEFVSAMAQNFESHWGNQLSQDVLTDPDMIAFTKKQHLRSMVIYPPNDFDQTLLLHSELNSSELAKYQAANFLPVYLWSHGIISQDWYRFAKHDKSLDFESYDFDQDFLIYCRAWTGTRQYRLKFLQDIKNKQLHKNVTAKFSTIDTDVHYSTVAVELGIDSDLHQHFSHNTASSDASADYDVYDYKRCAVELVLETIYQDNRIHLTEKTCRPLACGKPFLLAAGPGSLKLLQKYGFKTFAPYINESYDNEADPNLRRQMIIAEMQRLSAISDKQKLWTNLHSIAQHNRRHFASIEFTNLLLAEFQTNINQAFEQLTKNKTFRKTLEQTIKNKSYRRVFEDVFVTLSTMPSQSSGND